MMKKIIKVLGLLMIVITALGLYGCQRQESSWQKIKERGTLVIGVDDSFVPMDFRQKNGKLVGFDVDLATAVCKKIGLKPDFQTIDWSMKETELRNGTIDVIWNGYTKTKARAKKVAFSRPYLENDQILVTRKKDKIDNYRQMKGKVLGVQTGSSGADDLDNYPNVLKKRVKSIVLYDTYNNAFIDLKAGRITGLLIYGVYANYYLVHSKYQKEFKKEKLPYPSEKFSVGINKKDKILKDKINQALEHLEKTGELEKIRQKWFN